MLLSYYVELLGIPVSNHARLQADREREVRKIRSREEEEEERKGEI